MRLAIIAGLTFLLSGCQLTTPAPLLVMPVKPELKTQKVTLGYHLVQDAISSRLKIKSVQLPSHSINPKQTIDLDLVKSAFAATGIEYDLANTIAKQLSKKGFSGEKKPAVADYKLTLNKLEHGPGDAIRYQLVTPDTNQEQSQSCASVNTEISIRLTHINSGDVVWFAQASINSARYLPSELIYEYELHQEISNQDQVTLFVAKNNTHEARVARATTEVKIPAYEINTRPSQLTKISGSCTQAEVDSFAPEITTHLLALLINKLNVTGGSE